MTEAAVASQRRIRLSIGGEWLEGREGEAVPLVSPATGEEIALVEQGVREDVERGVEAAQRALEPLVRMTAFERARLCHAVADLVLDGKDEIALDISADWPSGFRPAPSTSTRPPTGSRTLRQAVTRASGVASAGSAACTRCSR
jgi:Aldehyde dehydrogenase family